MDDVELSGLQTYSNGILIGAKIAVWYSGMPLATQQLVLLVLQWLRNGQIDVQVSSLRQPQPQRH